MRIRIQKLLISMVALGFFLSSMFCCCGIAIAKADASPPSCHQNTPTNNQPHSLCDSQDDQQCACQQEVSIIKKSENFKISFLDSLIFQYFKGTSIVPQLLDSQSPPSFFLIGLYSPSAAHNTIPIYLRNATFRL
jgi:hypothetical protein